MWTGKVGLARRILQFSWREAFTGISQIVLPFSSGKYTWLLSLCFVHRSVLPHRLLHTHTENWHFTCQRSRDNGTMPDHENPHPVKMLKSKYLNCSRALICMLEKLLNFVSLPTDFTVQVLSRKKASCEALPQICQHFLSSTHCLHQKVPAVWDHCKPRGLDLKWCVATPFPQRQAHCMWESCSPKERLPTEQPTEVGRDSCGL